MVRALFLKQNLLAIVIFSIAFLSLPVVVFAIDELDGPGGTSGPNTGDNTSGPNTGGGASGPNTGGQNTLQNPLNVNSFPKLIEKILKAITAIGIPIAILFIVFGGFKLVWAQGKPDALKIARSNLVWTLVGVAIFVGAVIIANIIVNTLCQVGIEGVGAC